MSVNVLKLFSIHNPKPYHKPSTKSTEPICKVTTKNQNMFII